jgi:hypothetical protein
MNREELLRLLINEGVSSDTYSLDGNFISDHIVLYENYNFWEVFYADEKGNKTLLKRCKNEEDACLFIHNYLIEGFLSEKSIFFSEPPVIIPKTSQMIQKISLLELSIRIWLDSTIAKEISWPDYVTGAFWGIERDIKNMQNYICHLFGTRNADDTNNSLPFEVAVVPFYDRVSIKSGMDEADFIGEFSTLVRKCVSEPEYRGFFERKTIYVDFLGNKKNGDCGVNPVQSDL